jgi:protein-disulfide isomerase
MIITGNPSAAGTLLIFSDYDCLYCRQFIIEDLPWIENTYLPTGKLKLERIILPLTPVGDFMARAALCGAEKNKFRQIDRLLSASPVSDVTQLLPVMKALKLQVLPFRECLTSLSTQKLIDHSANVANVAGVSRVPTFILGEKTWTGILEQGELKQTIDDYLRR